MNILCEFEKAVDEELHKKLDKSVKINGEQEVILSPELKIKHKDSGILYTVDTIGRNEVILRTPEGDEIVVDDSTLENEYVLS